MRESGSQVSEDFQEFKEPQSIPLAQRQIITNAALEIHSPPRLHRVGEISETSENAFEMSKPTAKIDGSFTYG